MRPTWEERLRFERHSIFEEAPGMSLVMPATVRSATTAV